MKFSEFLNIPLYEEIKKFDDIPNEWKKLATKYVKIAKGSDIKYKKLEGVTIETLEKSIRKALRNVSDKSAVAIEISNEPFALIVSGRLKGHIDDNENSKYVIFTRDGKLMINNRVNPKSYQKYIGLTSEKELHTFKEVYNTIIRELSQLMGDEINNSDIEISFSVLSEDPNRVKKSEERDSNRKFDDSLTINRRKVFANVIKEVIPVILKDVKKDIEISVTSDQLIDAIFDAYSHGQNSIDLNDVISSLDSSYKFSNLKGAQWDKMNTFVDIYENLFGAYYNGKIMTKKVLSSQNYSIGNYVEWMLSSLRKYERKFDIE